MIYDTVIFRIISQKLKTAHHLRYYHYTMAASTETYLMNKNAALQNKVDQSEKTARKALIEAEKSAYYSEAAQIEIEKLRAEHKLQLETLHMTIVSLQERN